MSFDGQFFEKQKSGKKKVKNPLEKKEGTTTSHSRAAPSDNEMHIHLKAGGWQFNAETEAATAEETRASPSSSLLLLYGKALK